MRTRYLWIAAAVLAAVAAWLLFGPRHHEHPTRSADSQTASAAAAVGSRSGVTGAAGAGTSTSVTPPVDGAADDDRDPDEPAPMSSTTLPAGRWTGGEPSDVATAGQQAWRPVLTAFTRDFPDHSPGWAQRLANWATPELAQTLTYADPRTAPEGTVTAGPTVVAESDVLTDVKVTYSDKETFTIRLQMLPQGWRVAQITPAR